MGSNLILDRRLWSMDDFSRISVLKGGEAKEQEAVMDSWKIAANNIQLLAKTSENLATTVFITPPYFSSHHMIITASSLTVFATNGAFLRYKLNLS